MITLTPDPADVYDLDHYEYYTWGVSTDEYTSLAAVTGAVLRFDNIRNWQTETNSLYVSLLDSAPEGVTVYPDNQGGGDAFAGQGTHLVTYQLPNYEQDLTYTFTASEVQKLNEYMTNGDDFALGFDPDCHYYNDGVSMTLFTTEVPEPVTAGLLILGGVPLIVRRIRRT